MTKKKVDNYFYIFILVFALGSLFWFKADLGEGYNILYFSLFAFGVGLRAGVDINIKKEK
jgi:hypothetical protein